jgi:hypothetical protein
MKNDTWGTRLLVSTDDSRVLTGEVMLKEQVDEGLLRRDLDVMGLSGPIVKMMNHWFVRKLGQDTWLKIGTSGDPGSSAHVRWDSTSVENGDYEVLQEMNVFVKQGSVEKVVTRSNTVRVAVNN